VLATLRRDGSPRVSGTELIFAEGKLWLGSMAGAVKARDLLRDPRFALHGGTEDPPAWTGDVKVAGRAVDIGDAAVLARVVGDHRPADPMQLFRAELGEVTIVWVDEAAVQLVVESWHPGRGVEIVRR